MKGLLFAPLIAASVATFLIGGCADYFPYEEPEKVDVSDVVTAQMAMSKLEVVEAPIAPDRPMGTQYYAPTFFAGIDGFSRVKVLCENDYFKYDLLTEPDIDGVDILTEPTNISVTMYDSDVHTSDDWRLKFSCFIYSIEEDYIYLGTAGHCIENSSLKYNTEIMFFNRETVNLTLDENVLGSGFSTYAGDYAMYRIPTDTVSYELLLQLKQACYDPEAVDSVMDGDSLICSNIYARNQSEDYDIRMTTLGMNDYRTEYYSSYFGWLISGNYFIGDKAAVGGQSGSGVFDAYGNVVAVVSGQIYDSTYPTIGVYTKSNLLPEMYEALKFQ